VKRSTSGGGGEEKSGPTAHPLTPNRTSTRDNATRRGAGLSDAENGIASWRVYGWVGR
jgi:hypothetical protein